MKKRNYRAIDVKDIGTRTTEKLVEKGGGRLVFGNDAAKDKWVGALMNESREVLLTLKWDVLEDRDRILSLLGEQRERGVAIEVVLEPTGTYANAMAAQYEAAGFPVYWVSAKHTHDYSEVYDSVPSSHDGKSAAVAADLRLSGKAQRRWQESEEERRDLKAAAKRMDWATDAQTRCGNHLEAMLAEHWPELCRLVDVMSASSLALLEAYGSPKAVAADPTNALALLKKTGRSALATEKREAILTSAKTTVGIPMSRGEVTLMRQVATSARECAKEHDAAHKALAALSDSSESAKRCAPVVGKATAAVLVANLGEFSGYSSAKSLIKAAGLNLTVHSSGKHAGQLRVSKRGSRVARRWLFLAALRWIKDDPVVRAWYEAKLARNGGKKLKGIIAVMRKLLSALYHVARGAELDLSLLFDVRRLDVQH